MGTAARQWGHSKSANSTTVTGASSGPLVGEPARGSVWTVEGSKRALYERSMSSSDAPPRTRWAMALAAWAHWVQARFSSTQVASDTGTLGQGANSSVTSELNSWRSRGVMALVSTPG